jgi:DNA-binding CsgD family transcriptional regulator
MYAFVGRQRELAVLRARLADARAGMPQIVLIQGPAGIGKTTLVARFLAEPGERPAPKVLRASGEEAEMLLAYGVLDQLARSAGHDGAALIGGSPGAPAADVALEDTVTVGTRLLELLDSLDATGSVVVVVDDLQWADQPSIKALVFALRRLVADQVLVLFTVREESVAELPESVQRLVRGPGGSVLRLGGLDEQDLRDLAGQMGFGPLSAPAARRLRYSTRGNPLHARALLEEFPAAEWASGDRPLPPPRSFRLLVERRYEACRPDTRRLVDATAVLAPRCPLPLAAALGEVEDPVQAVDEAVGRGLLEAATDRTPWTLAFPHPLVRSAVLDALGPARRSALHTAAAALVEDEAAALRHRVEAAAEPDAGLTADLVAFAQREARGQAWPAAATHLVQAARLSPEPADRQRHLLCAVTWMLQTGDAASAAAFAEEVRGFPASPLRDSVLGSLEMARCNPVAAETYLCRAWEACGPDTEPEIVATIALQHALHRYGRLDAGGCAEWSRWALAHTGPDTVTRAMARYYLAHSLGGSGRTAEAFAATAGADAADTGFAWLHLRSARGILRLAEDDLDGARADLAAVATASAQLGIPNKTAFALASLARAEFLAGAWEDAVLHAGRAVAVNDESEYGFTRAMVLATAALVPAARGEWAAAEAMLGPDAARSSGDYERSVVAVAIAKARLAESRGDPEAVLAALAPIPDLPFRDTVDEPGFWPWADLYADALVAVGRAGEADALLVPHEKRAAQRGRLSAMARLGRARGRVEAAAGRSEQAERAFTEALAAGRVPLPFERAKVELAAGQFLRREGKRRRAAELLTAAHRAFTVLGAEPWVQRCATELAAAGLRPAARRGADRVALTSQELVVAHLAAVGRTNREIAAELVVSVKTVEYHLRNVFQKLGIGRRRQLAAWLAEPSGTA